MEFDKVEYAEGKAFKSREFRQVWTTPKARSVNGGGIPFDGEVYNMDFFGNDHPCFYRAYAILYQLLV